MASGLDPVLMDSDRESSRRTMGYIVRRRNTSLPRGNRNEIPYVYSM